MRKDMGKVVVERPRRGSHQPNIHTRQKYRGPNVDYDEVDENVSTKKIGHKKLRGYEVGYDGKELNEFLNPLRKFVMKNCGRPWDKVFSEIVAVCPPNSVLGHHIINDHLFSYVDIHTYEEDGEIYVNSKYGGKKVNVKDVSQYKSFGAVGYVHPRTGILTKYKNRTNSYSYLTPRQNEQELNFIKVSEGVHWIKEKGTWFAHEYTFDPGTDIVTKVVVDKYYTKLPDGTYGTTYKKETKERRFFRGYEPWIYKGKRTLGKKEIKTILPENCGNYEHFKRLSKFIPSKYYKK